MSDDGEHVWSEDLRVGDVLRVWWAPGRDTIVSFTDYRGPLAELQGARIAHFAMLPSGMTLCPRDWFVVLHRGLEPRDSKPAASCRR